MWIHEHQGWPELTWDAGALASTLAGVRYRQGRLLGRMESLGFDLRRKAGISALTSDVVKSSAIEGKNLDSREVRSSIVRRLGMDAAGLVVPGREVEGVVEMALNARRRFSQPLTRERLLGWHAALFPTGRSGMRPITVGAWRTPESGSMQVGSGSMGRETVHFEAPDAHRLEDEMRTFLAWFNDDTGTDPVLRAGIAHFRLVTIHPFEDGNGRIARTVGDMALARADGTAERFYSLSRQIESERKGYYRQLERQQRATPDITGWLQWFLGCLDRAVADAETTLGNVLHKARLWERINENPVNERQRMIINRMLEDDFKGYMNTSKYARMAKCSNDTALRDIQDLQQRRIFLRNPGGGRSTSYRLPGKDD